MPRPTEKPSRPLTQAEIAAQVDPSRAIYGARDLSQLPRYGSARVSTRSSRVSA